MDQITHEVRLAQWAEIIRNCQLRPEGQSTKDWVAENGINIKTYYYWQRRVRKELYEKATALSTVSKPKTEMTFAEVPDEALELPVLNGISKNTIQAPDAVIRAGSMEIEIHNSLSPMMLKSILEVATHAR
jgi:hypothetical protein